jgi:hypothetical protein
MAGPRLPNLEKATPSQSLPSQFPGLRRRPSHCSRFSRLPAGIASAGPIRCGLAIFVTRLFLCSSVIPSARLDSLQLLVLRTLVPPGRYGCGNCTWSLVTKRKRVRTPFGVRTLLRCCNSLDAETSVRRALPVLRTTRLAAARRPLLPRAPGAAPRIRRTSRSSTYGR